MRVQINLSDDILTKVEAEAKRLGTTRGAMLTTWIGEKINTLDQTRAMLNEITKKENFEEFNRLLKVIMQSEQEEKKGENG